MNDANDTDTRPDPHAAEDKANRETLVIDRQHLPDFGEQLPIPISDLWIGGERFVRATAPDSSETVIRDFLSRLATALQNVETTAVPLAGQGMEDAREATEHSGATFSIGVNCDWWTFEALVYGDKGRDGYVAKTPMPGDPQRADVGGGFEDEQGDAIDRLLEVLGLKSYVS